MVIRTEFIVVRLESKSKKQALEIKLETEDVFNEIMPYKMLMELSNFQPSPPPTYAGV